MNRIIAIVVCLGVTLLGLVGLSAPAGAHTPQVTSTCESLHVSLASYPKGSKVTTVVDGKQVASETFGPSYDKTFAFSSKYVSHDYVVSIDSSDGKQYDKIVSGHSTACPQPVQPQPNKRDHVTSADCSHSTVQHVFEEQPYVWDGSAYVLGEWQAVRTDEVTNPAYPCPVVNPPRHTVVPPVTFTHTGIRVKVTDHCNCYFDRVKVRHYDHTKMTVTKTKRGNRTWVIRVTGKMVGGVQYVVPSKIGGHSGWGKSAVYKIRTKNQTCPCVKAGNCKVKYPNFHPHHYCAPARSKC